MKHNLYIYNTLSRKKEKFEPLKPPFVGMYVCGPTVYGEPHLGHTRPSITFDVLFRYLKYLGYKVRYVRNITDVGHLEDEVAGEGEDRIAKKARIEQVEPMEVVQKYKNIFSGMYDLMNVLSPSIEPLASGHIIEQIEMIKEILNNGYAYIVNGSVYFDIEKYNSKHLYGKLSGRKIEDLLTNTREMEGQGEKRNPLDFALWKKAMPEHIMRWPSEWSNGFPGWHLECSAMGTKYLGKTFDIHGGGMDLLFPHHECEIAQSVAANNTEHVKYWMHNNMITIDGQKMGKSLNNFITMNEIFTGNHPKLQKAYSPMTIRFFILQSHYRSTLDFSNDALLASEKGLEKLMNALNTLQKIQPQKKSSVNIEIIRDKCFEAMDDDLNTPIVLAQLFEGVKIINSVKDGKECIDQIGLELLKTIFNDFVFEILGLKNQKIEEVNNSLTDDLMDLIIKIRLDARANKDFDISDKIRISLNRLGIEIKDTKNGTDWVIK